MLFANNCSKCEQLARNILNIVVCCTLSMNVLEMHNGMHEHMYMRSAICMNDTILSTCTSPPVYALTYATAATDTNTYFAPILPSLRQTMYRLLSCST